jgi:hypothetical protein
MGDKMDNKIEGLIIGFIGIGMLMGIYLGNQNVYLPLIGVLGGYVGNQVKDSLSSTKEEDMA